MHSRELEATGDGPALGSQSGKTLFSGRFPGLVVCDLPINLHPAAVRVSGLLQQCFENTGSAIPRDSH